MENIKTTNQPPETQLREEIAYALRLKLSPFL